MIIATAGHVDHGKTSLVRNLTGVETDRLEEEQRRGLSINLGYAYLPLNNETTLGFIDVPGHRRFINNMIAGVTGIDLGMLIVAADDGPMPQTLEHLQVMNLLGVKAYLLVISKCDRVDEQRIEQVRKDCARLLPENTPVYRVSNSTGLGVDELRAELERLAGLCAHRIAAGNFRMSIDRAFHLQGRGLILTGTVASGTIASGEVAILQPHQTNLRVRSIHAQDAPVTSASAGERCALNVSGDIHRDNIERGDWIVGESCIGTTSRFDARIRLLPEAAFALKHLSEVKLHIGAKHLQARLMLLRNDDDSPARINPGETALAQLLTDRPILCCHGDRFLLRDHGETATLGGGMVLDPFGSHKRKSSQARLSFLAAMEENHVEDAIRITLSDPGYALNYPALLQAWNLDPQDRPGLDLADIARINTADGEIWIAESHWSDLKGMISHRLLEFHQEKPTKAGIKVTVLMNAALPVTERRFFQSAIVQLIETGDVLFQDGLLSAKGHKASPSLEEESDWLIVSTCLRKHGRQIPTMGLLEKETQLESSALQQTIGRAERAGQLIKISQKRVAHVAVIRDFAVVALELTQDKPTLNLIEYRDYLGCGRNVAVDVLEYFDAIRFTRRVGESRIILNKKLPDKLFVV